MRGKRIRVRFKKKKKKSVFLRWFAACVCSVPQSCSTVCDATNCSPPCSSVHGFSQARKLEGAVISYSKASSQPRDQTRISCVSLASRFLTTAPPGNESTCSVLSPEKPPLLTHVRQAGFSSGGGGWKAPTSEGLSPVSRVQIHRQRAILPAPLWTTLQLEALAPPMVLEGLPDCLSRARGSHTWRCQ